MLFPDRKFAYRYLLYWAYIEIRQLVWSHEDDESALKKVATYSCSLADALHNLALYSANDFAGFDESWFWEYRIPSAKASPTRRF